MKTITVGQLRENPTEALAEVERGEVYAVTRHNREIFTRTEVMAGKNLIPNHRIGLVIVDPDDPTGDELRYLVNYFAAEPDPAFDTTRVVKSLGQLWDGGGEPC